ncbi:MAG: hypothetical protein AAF039_14065 [Bacteroidota bacterium]
MKAITYMIIVLTLSLFSCSSQKKMVDQPPLELGKASCQSWLGGRPEAGSGLLLEVPILSGDMGNVKLQQAYFRGKIAAVIMESTENGWVAKANFKNQNTGKPDMVMHSDSKQEVGNQPPKLNGKFPFELNPDQCVLSYMDADTLKYFKVEGIKEKQPLIYK